LKTWRAILNHRTFAYWKGRLRSPAIANSSIPNRPECQTVFERNDIAMTNEQREFLNLRVKPAVSRFIEASFILNIHVDGLVYLEKIGELKALGNPPPGAQRYFSTSYLFKLAQDDRWLARALRLIRENSKRLNGIKKERKLVEAGQHQHRVEADPQPLTAIQSALQIARTASCTLNAKTTYNIQDLCVSAAGLMGSRPWFYARKGFLAMHTSGAGSAAINIAARSTSPTRNCACLETK